MRTVPHEQMTCRHAGVPASSGGHAHLDQPGRYSRYILTTDRR